jgi:hypothetical protein
MAEQRAYHDVYDAPWIEGGFRPLLTAILAASAVTGPLVALRTLSGWPLPYVFPLAAIAAGVGIVSARRLGRPNRRDQRGLAFRLGELLLLWCAARVAAWAMTGFPPLAQWAVWLRQPGAFFDPHFLITGLLTTMAWGLAVAITSDFADLALQPDELAARQQQGWDEVRSQMRAFRPTPRSEIVAHMAQRWIWGGAGLIVCAALVQVRFTTDERQMVRLGLAQAGLSVDILAGLVGYFLAGLLLLSQARLAMLRGQWYNEGADISAALLRRWHVNTLAAVLLVAGLAAFLPIGATEWLGRALETLIAIVMQVAYALGILLMLLFSLLLYPLRFLLRPGSEPARPLPSPSQLAIPSQSQMAGRLPDWLGGALAWMVIAGIGLYFILSYLRGQGRLGGSWDALWLRLRFWWRSRWTRIAATTQSVTAVLRSRLRRPRTSAAPRRPRPDHGIAPTPRARIRQLYLEALDRAAEAGLTRPPHTTPLEFEHDLAAHWREADPEIHGLTEAFVAARYDQRPILDTDADQARLVWRRLVTFLRKAPSSPLANDR